MPSKKKIQFNNIIREFGFPVTLDKLRCTYKPECFDERSDLSWKMEEFEAMIDNEIEKQNSNAYTDENIDYYEQFEKIFLSHADIFDPEVYMLQLSVQLEQDQLTREKIKALINRTQGISSSPEFIEHLAVKDDEAINHLTKILQTRGTSSLDIMKIRQYILGLPEENVWIPSSNDRTISSLLSTIKNRLRNSDVVLIDSARTSINVVNSQVHIGNENYLKKKEAETQTRFDEASKEIDLDAEIKKLTPSDIKHVFRYENLGLELAERLYYSQEAIDNNEDKTLLREDLTDRVYAQEEILSIVKSNMRYVDFDKLLLSILQVEYDEYGDNINYFTYDEARRLKELSERVEKLLVDRDVELNSDRFFDIVTFEKLKEKIDTLNNSYIAGVYYDQKEIEVLSADYIDGRKDVKTLTPHEFKDVLKFTDNEILNMLKKDPTVLEYLIQNRILESEDKKEDPDKVLFDFLEKQDKIPTEQLEILYANKKLTQSYMFDLYMHKDKIDIESIHDLKGKVDDLFFYGMTDVQELTTLYLSDDESDHEMFEKYRKLFKVIEIDGKTLEERNDISNSILDQSLDLLEEDKILELYSLGLVTIDVLIDFTGQTSLKDLLLSNDLKPIDARRLFYQGIIKEEMLEEIMKDPSIDQGKKITLLYSTFPDEEDTEIMKRLEKCLDEVEENSISGGSSSNSGSRRQSVKENTEEDELKKIKTKRAYEPRAKYRLIETIDKDYEFNYNEKDGTGVFYFPNRGEYLIEKLYAKGRKPATDVATYILSEDLFHKNSDRIIQDGRVNITELYSIKKSQTSGVKRFVHTGWANAIVKYYGLDDERRYSKKQIESNKKLAKQVEESKKEIER